MWRREWGRGTEGGESINEGEGADAREIRGTVSLEIVD